MSGGGRLPAAVDVSETAQGVHRNDSLQKESGVQEVAVLVQGAVSGVGPEAHFLTRSASKFRFCLVCFALPNSSKTVPASSLLSTLTNYRNMRRSFPFMAGDAEEKRLNPVSNVSNYRGNFSLQWLYIN